MRTVVCLAGAAILLATLASRVVAQPCPDVTGCWEGSYSSPTGAFPAGTLGIALEQTGASLSGAFIAQDSVFGTQVGSLSGFTICDTLTFTATWPIAFFMTVSAQVTGDCMAGQFVISPLPAASGTWQACRVDCVCGDGLVTVGEQCDDGNLVAGDGCRPDCTLELCGDGILDPQEECDDGNLIDGDGCDVVCRPTGCGNGHVTAGEQCDDGNLVGGDGCRANCTLELCGDGILDPQEQCDDGNLIDGDGCDVNCRPTGCGNGHVTTGEQCDDGNTIDDDCCHNDCTTAPFGTGCEPATPAPVGLCDGSGHCVGIPTLSQWGVMALSVLMLAAVIFDRRRGIVVRRR